MAPGTDLSFLAGEISAALDTTLPTKTAKISSATPSQGIIVLDPSLIPTDFDLLRFEAAAYGQLHIAPDRDDNHDESSHASGSPLLSSLLISSPYNNPGHYLDLASLDTSNFLLSKALTALKPLRSDYATAPYTEALNLDFVVELLGKFAADEKFEWKEQAFYVVSFRSKLMEVVDNELLYTLDYESHREACESGGLLKYWFGAPNGERRNLATCFWRSREDARLGGLGPWHKKARSAGRELYGSIVFSTHRFTILDGATGFKFEDWE
ncbi:hypothetical protein K505DRAFT_372401 [Melanomma pulvis-pyrius CBS 109.77]|uniref:Uncharacterized protein n=1 Tax=Melanomma pulvis-pyrius CBS 109.77 TaxID=1314802 RepID=A0A6A6XMI1_9PLEO|nr:hypothetical protein K505DRAFT_372401 [Melanomma pulvis-pyrius CBS 109.77]